MKARHPCKGVTTAEKEHRPCPFDALVPRDRCPHCGRAQIRENNRAYRIKLGMVHYARQRGIGLAKLGEESP